MASPSIEPAEDPICRGLQIASQRERVEPDELGRKPDTCEFVETWALNSNKCFAVFNP